MSKLRRIDTYSKVPFEGNLGISVYFLTSGPYDKNNIIDGSSVAAHVVSLKSHFEFNRPFSLLRGSLVVSVYNK
jgi:hypothetical protein